MKSPSTLVAVSLIVAGFFQINQVLAEDGLEKRFQNVETLIEKSSASQRIDSSGNPDALAKKEEARKLYSEARDAASRGDADAANQMLGRASQLMFMAVKDAKPKDIENEKFQRDFDNRAQSVNALLEAHTRVAEEKNLTSETSETTNSVKGLIAESQKLFETKKFDEARIALDRAYTLLKAGIEKMRGGDTLVRDLKFANKEEEYHYELDRNDTHQMLVKVLLKDKDLSGSKGERVQKFIDEAAKLRVQAETEASSGKFEEAVTTLESATSNLVRAIRIAGVYIPG